MLFTLLLSYLPASGGRGPGPQPRCGVEQHQLLLRVCPQRFGERQVGVRRIGFVDLELVDRIGDAGGGR